MKTAVIRSTWMEGYGYRLDCSPYLGGALETKVLLEKLPLRKDPLHTLTAGFDGGIYNGPKFSRTWVESPEYGVPFVGSSAMLRADLSDLPLLSKKRAYGRQLRHLEIKPGMSLISCSGTIGKMVYARPDMAGIWSSQHILKVVPDPAKVPSGYLYAYLSSKFGIPLIVSGTYGSIIQSIGPGDLNRDDFQVPRLGDALEDEAHSLVEESAKLLSESSKELCDATSEFFASVGLKQITNLDWFDDREKDLGFGATIPGPYSLRAMNFAPRFVELCARMRTVRWKTLGDLCTPGLLWRGGRYKRIDADPEYGYLLLSQRDLFALFPEGRWIARNSVGNDILLEPGTIAVAARGTLGEGELYARAQFVWGPWTSYAYSEDILRIASDESQILRGCLFAFLRSETGFRMLRGVSSGSKLQDNHYYFLPRLPVPLPKRPDQEKINEMVVSAIEKRHRAVASEQKAVRLVEATIDAYGR